jgi:nitroreductase
MLKPLIFSQIDEEEMIIRSSSFLTQMKTRRSVREFSDRTIPFEVVKNVVMTASSAPSGANKQPWTFVIVNDPEIKRKIRLAAEKEEKEFYDHRAPEEWLEDLEPLGTDWHKPFLESAPYLIVVFKKIYDIDETEATRPEYRKNYYVNESAGIASGFLLTAIHNAGLAALTHTPSPMGFLSEILNRPANEKPFLLIPVGYPVDDTQVPVLEKKSFEEVATVF